MFNEEEPDGHYRLVLNKKEVSMLEAALQYCERPQVLTLDTRQDRDLFVHLIELAAGDSEANVDKCCFQANP